MVITFFSVLFFFFLNWYNWSSAGRRFCSSCSFLPLSHSRGLRAGCQELPQGGADCCQKLEFLFSVLRSAEVKEGEVGRALMLSFSS